MLLFVRAVVTGFGLALGAAVFKKHVAPRLGLEDEVKDKEQEALSREAPSDPGLQGVGH